jgi:hypothetical protein
MKKLSNPYCRQGSKTWFAKVDGKALQLAKKGSSEEEAKAAWAILRLKIDAENGVINKDETARRLDSFVGLYLNQISKEVSEGTLRQKTYLLAPCPHPRTAEPPGDRSGPKCRVAGCRGRTKPLRLFPRSTAPAQIIPLRHTEIHIFHPDSLRSSFLTIRGTAPVTREKQDMNALQGTVKNGQIVLDDPAGKRKDVGSRIETKSGRTRRFRNTREGRRGTLSLVPREIARSPISHRHVAPV